VVLEVGDEELPLLFCCLGILLAVARASPIASLFRQAAAVVVVFVGVVVVVVVVVGESTLHLCIEAWAGATP
jgi:hypothetical protein